MVLCASGMARSSLLFRIKAKTDGLLCRQLIDCLRLRHGVCCHVIIMWLSGLIRARFAFCIYPHVSMSSSSILIAATGRCRCLKIWTREFAVLKQRQSQHSWQSFSFRIYRCLSGSLWRDRSLVHITDPTQVCRSVSQLVGALSPVNHKGLHQGWTQTSLYLKVIHFTSHHTICLFVFLFLFVCLFVFLGGLLLFFAYLYSAGTQHGNLHPAGWPILFCGPTQEPLLATANTGKTRKRFGENAGEWTGKLEISKE